MREMPERLRTMTDVERSNAESVFLFCRCKGRYEQVLNARPKPGCEAQHAKTLARYREELAIEK